MTYLPWAFYLCCRCNREYVKQYSTEECPDCCGKLVFVRVQHESATVLRSRVSDLRLGENSV